MILENSEFKPVKLCLKIDLVAEKLGKYKNKDYKTVIQIKYYVNTISAAVSNSWGINCKH